MLNGDSDSPVYATDPNIKPAKQTWLLHHQDDGTVLLQNKLFGKYIGIATDLKPNVTLVATNSAIKFVMEHIKDDSYKLELGYCLSALIQPDAPPSQDICSTWR
ncbi:hypothetical protein FRC09_002698 [Ceratobasidium sp. 395]|nr:hypothetical protein FRC09_002698 [Ceratobasidium sp. 395]